MACRIGEFWKIFCERTQIVSCLLVVGDAVDIFLDFLPVFLIGLYTRNGKRTPR